MNEKQQLAYNVVKFHFETKSLSPLHLIITGQGGSGKSYVSNAICSLVLDNSIVASCFGIASFNISGVTLHTLLCLPIRGRNTCDLKGKALAQLQEKLKNVKYVIIDEFSVIGLRMLGWIDKCLQQARGLMNTVFGGYSIIMVGDIAQLPPVLDRPLYCPPTEDPIIIMGCYA